jgi:hypothetical protein
MEFPMMHRALLSLGLLVAPLTLMPALAAGPWDGTYVWEQGLGKNPGGIALFVTHTLKINGSDCRIDAQGVQSDEHIRCKATANGDKLDVAFASFADGGMNNQFGKKIYAPNQPLFTLTRQGNAIATTWQGYSKNEVDTTGKSTFTKQGSAR